VSLENQNYTWRIRHLQKSPAFIRFISIEPLLSPISLDESLLNAIQWVIVGGESGPQARPMKPEWVYAIRNQCKKYDVPFFFKQWGAYDPTGKRVGKKVAGRILDGKTWDDIPIKLLSRQKIE
jgi:protein gp37